MRLSDLSPRPAFFTLACFGLLAAAASSLAAAGAGEADRAAAVATVQAAGVSGGLCVQIGAGETEFVAELARTGRFLVQVLDEDQAVVDRARARLRAAGLYGLVSVDRPDGTGTLPYTENLVNLLIVTRPLGGRWTAEQIKRVVCPSGVVLAASGTVSIAELDAADLEDTRPLPQGWFAGRKPWPAEMDQWSHAHHSASGNAVSQDTLVGPPRRVRWLAGPWQEVSNLVTADGRNYYGGLLARDSFNGLRLWRRQLDPSPSRGGFGYRPAAGSVPPVAGDGRVFVFTDGQLQALDGRTGETERAYPEAVRPRQVLYDEGTLIVVGQNQVQALDAARGGVRWAYEASEPRFVVAAQGRIVLVRGSARRGEQAEVTLLDKVSGRPVWSRDFAWAADITRSVAHEDLLTFEVSTLNDDGPGTAIHVVSATDGAVRWSHEFFPGMSHMRQARAMFVGNRLWLLHGGKDDAEKILLPQISAFDLATGQIDVTHPAGLAHCFPPVATVRYFISGELDLTDLETGRVDANRISKAACGRDGGWVPANGLIYVMPKHCVCWPMLRGYAALAPARPGGNPARAETAGIDFLIERAAEPPAAEPAAAAWPCYRHDAWRSSSTGERGPAELDTLWAVKIDQDPVAEGPVTQDWDDDPFTKGRVTPPVVAGGSVFVARPHAHELLALDAASGAERWRFTANGRIDLPPTIHRGLCLFGTAAGWVYCLRADDGRLVWRLRAAPLAEQIVAYGQLESPWPVPGSVLVVDDVVYFAAGRQSLADGGILVFGVEPATGAIRWVERLDSVPQQGFYESSAMNFDNFDLLHREGGSVAMSRWLFDRATGKMSVDRWRAFARLNTGGGSAMVPQGNWSYAPQNRRRAKVYAPRRPLVVFWDNVLLGCAETRQSIYSRTFDLEGGEKFDSHWITGWASDEGQKKGLAWRSQRLAEKAAWSVDIFEPKTDGQTIDAMVRAGDALYLAGSAGQLRVVSTAAGHELGRRDIPPPLWDGLAVAGGHLYISTRDGQLLCLGKERLAAQ